jgi:glycosyltransferase involved in cell wall biosynthesis
MNVLLLTRYGQLGASSRLRSLQYLPALKREGIEVTVQPLISDDLLGERYARGRHDFASLSKVYGARISALLRRQTFDLVWTEKEALPWLPAMLEKLLMGGIPYVLDYDDAIFHGYDMHRYWLVRRTLGRKIDALMRDARLVVSGNDYLAQRARDAGASWVEIIPTVVDLARYDLQPHASLDHVMPRIVWIGSPSTVKYIAGLAGPLKKLAQLCDFELRVIGGVLDMPGVAVKCIPWTEQTEVAEVAACDVGVMPLDDSPWEKGKCGYKLIQYMACGLPVVASAVGANVDIVVHGGNGFLVNDADEWVAALHRLLTSPERRKEMGQAGRKRVEEQYCLQKTGPRLVELLRAASER